MSLFFKRVLPLTPINSHCLINTPKKVQHPDLFVGCDSEYNKIKANSFLFGFFSSIYSAQLFWVPKHPKPEYKIVPELYSKRQRDPDWAHYYEEPDSGVRQVPAE